MQFTKKVAVVVILGMITAAFFVFWPRPVPVAAPVVKASVTQEKKLVAAAPAVPTLTFAHTAVQVLLADTDALREQGLSNHAPLAVDEGMLFLFTTPSRYGFWMKDMLFSLDMIWISADWHVVDITPNLSPATYPQVYFPKQNVEYVLEVPAGFAQAHGIVVGASASFKK